MKFFVQMTERQTFDSQELAAMLRHRLDSITYQQKLLDKGDLAYAFRTKQGNQSVLMYEINSLEYLDLLIKRDPHFPYSEIEVVPVVSTETLVREAQEYLNEQIFSDNELPKLNFPRKPINSEATYWLAYKKVKPFSPLLSEEEQNDVHRRTILAQQGHFDDLEFADDNPVGKPVGILVAECSLEKVQAHVETCDVYPDTVVIYNELLPLKRAWNATVQEIVQLRRPVPTSSLFK
jgi:muconolactone delta-isomerase